MRTIPRTIEKKIEFFEHHLPRWEDNAETLGLTPEQLAALTGRITRARSSYDTAQTLRQQAKNATESQRTAIASMLELGSAMVATIRARADMLGNDPDIFKAAGLSQAKEPAPLPPPLPATTLKTTLRNSGAIEIAWQGTTANGTCYTLWRTIGPDAPAVLLGAVCAKRFVDEMIPAGTAEASYFLRTHRGELTSDDSTHVTVRFGVTGKESTAQTTPALPAGALVTAA